MFRLELARRAAPVMMVAVGAMLSGCSHRAGARPVGIESAAMPPARTTTPVAPAPDTASPADTTSGKWLSWDPSTKTATFKLVAGPFVFDGYGNGEAALTVPAGSKLVINFSQEDGTPHSAEVEAGDGPLPNAGGNPAIPRAYTNKVIEGLPQGATDVMRFPAPDSAATYRIICGVPGHALSGMWIWLKVDPGIKTPSFTSSKR